MSSTDIRHPLFAAGLAIVAACTPFNEAPSSVDAGEAGPGPGPGADAGADAPLAPGTPFCSIPRTGHLFCEDFETDKPPPFGFTDGEQNGAMIAAARMPVSGRGVVLVYQVNSVADINTWFRFATKDPASRNLAFTSVKLTMDVAIAMQAVTGVLIAGIWVNPLPSAVPIVHGVALHGNPELLSSQDGMPSGTPRPITLGAWQNISVELRTMGLGAIRHVSIDGQEVDVKAVPMPQNGEWDVRIGAYYGNQTALTMFIDNVVVTRE